MVNCAEFSDSGIIEGFLASKLEVVIDNSKNRLVGEMDKAYLITREAHYSEVAVLVLIV